MRGGVEAAWVVEGRETAFGNYVWVGRQRRRLRDRCSRPWCWTEVLRLPPFLPEWSCIELRGRDRDPLCSLRKVSDWSAIYDLTLSRLVSNLRRELMYSSIPVLKELLYSIVIGEYFCLILVESDCCFLVSGEHFEDTWSEMYYNAGLLLCLGILWYDRQSTMDRRGKEWSREGDVRDLRRRRTRKGTSQLALSSYSPTLRLYFSLCHYVSNELSSSGCVSFTLW